MTQMPSSRWLILTVAVAVVLVGAVTAHRYAAERARPPSPPQPGSAATEGAGLCCDDTPARPVADSPAGGKKRVLRISADPNNLPFTNKRCEGFENRIADVLARELGVELEYNWRAQRRGFFRHGLKEGECDLVLGVPAGFDMALTTAPYYRSTYVFVWRKDTGTAVKSLDDPVLKKMKIGVQMIGNDGTNTPPAHALADRGIIDNVVGYTVYGDYQEENPPARIIEGVAKGEVDVAVAWGPMAAYFARRQPVALSVAPVEPAVDPSGLPFTFAIAMGVRKGNKELRDEIDAILTRRKAEIDTILDQYGVPRAARPGPKGKK